MLDSVLVPWICPLKKKFQEKIQPSLPIWYIPPSREPIWNYRLIPIRLNDLVFTNITFTDTYWMCKAEADSTLTLLPETSCESNESPAEKNACGGSKHKLSAVIHAWILSNSFWETHHIYVAECCKLLLEYSVFEPPGHVDCWHTQHFLVSPQIKIAQVYIWGSRGPQALDNNSAVHI